MSENFVPFSSAKSGTEEPNIEIEPAQSSPEERKIKPELLVLIPNEFELTMENYIDALENIQFRHGGGNSIDSCRRRGYDYGQGKVFPSPLAIQMREIVGTEHATGWAGLVDGIGEHANTARAQSKDVAYLHAKKFLEMDPEQRNGLLNGIDMVMLGSWLHREFYIDSDGRHVVFMLKALQEMGCDISISGLKVTPLTRK